jgi:hypothetical protein
MYSKFHRYLWRPWQIPWYQELHQPGICNRSVACKLSIKVMADNTGLEIYAFVRFSFRLDFYSVTVFSLMWSSREAALVDSPTHEISALHYFLEASRGITSILFREKYLRHHQAVYQTDRQPLIAHSYQKDKSYASETIRNIFHWNTSLENSKACRK